MKVSHSIFGLILALLTVFASAAPCTGERPTRLIPEAGPQGTAMFPREIIQAEYQPPARMAERGHDHVVGMLNVVTLYPCSRGREASIEVQELSIVRWDEEQRAWITQATVRYDGRRSLYRLDSGQWRRSPEWFVSGQPALQVAVTRQTGGTLRLELGQIPDTIVHLWTEPRLKAESGALYGVAAVVRITGDARLQLGMDYWKGESSAYNGWSKGCVTSNNCEAWLSDWIGDTGGEFRLVYAPKVPLSRMP